MGRFNLRPETVRAEDGLSGGSDLRGQSILKWGLAQLERDCLIKMQGLTLPLMCMGVCVRVRACVRSGKGSDIGADCCRHLLPSLLWQLE